MSQAQPRPAAPNPKRNVKAIRTVRFWMAPIATTLALMSALAALYLGGILNPMTNLRHFPIALVNEDAGPAGQQIVDGLVSGLTRTSSTSEWFRRTRPGGCSTPRRCTARR